MTRWLFIALLAMQAHFAASYLVPLDAQAQRTFGGLLRWVWPWAVGDAGPLGRMDPAALPFPGLLLAVTSAGLLISAALAVARVWVPLDWWRPLGFAGSGLSILLMLLFLGPTKILPTLTGLAVAAAALGYWSALEA